MTSEATQEVTPQPPTETEAQDAPAVELGADGKPFDAERAQTLIEKLREENKAAKAAAKKLAELEAKEREREEAEMSELEKLTSKNAELEKQLHEMAQRAAAAKYNLPAELVTRLVGSTPEEVEADAAKLAAALPKQATLNPTNPAGTKAGMTDEQRRAFLYGGGSLT